MIRAALLWCFFCLGAVQAAPYLPADGGQVVQEVPKRSDPRQLRLKALRAAWQAEPRNLDGASALAQAYIVEGRRQADPRFYGYAEAALQPWWQLAAPPAQALLLRATLRQATHQFGQAQADLKALLRTDPENGQAWLTLATVQAVTGNYRDAEASCRALAPLVSASVLAACQANPYAATGRAAQAAAAIDAAASADDDPAILAWLAGLQGELAARLGQVQAAERHYLRALASDPGDSYVLGAYADLLLDQGRAEETCRLLVPHRRIDALLLRYAIALQMHGKDARVAIAELDARFAAAARRGASVHQREEARFALHLKRDPARALALAQANWQVQKEAADARILLEAAAAARQPGDAGKVLAWLRTHRFQDVEIERLAARFGRSG